MTVVENASEMVNTTLFHEKEKWEILHVRFAEKGVLSNNSATLLEMSVCYSNSRTLSITYHGFQTNMDG